MHSLILMPGSMGLVSDAVAKISTGLLPRRASRLPYHAYGVARQRKTEPASAQEHKQQSTAKADVSCKMVRCQRRQSTPQQTNAEEEATLHPPKSQLNQGNQHTSQACMRGCSRMHPVSTSPATRHLQPHTVTLRQRVCMQYETGQSL